MEKIKQLEGQVQELENLISSLQQKLKETEENYEAEIDLGRIQQRSAWSRTWKERIQAMVWFQVMAQPDSMESSAAWITSQSLFSFGAKELDFCTPTPFGYWLWSPGGRWGKFSGLFAPLLGEEASVWMLGQGTNSILHTLDLHNVSIQ